jgi:hypothetical protein
MAHMHDHTHEARINDVLSRLQETASRFAARLQAAGARAEHAAGGWTPAQIAAHVAMVNENLASVIDGTVGAASPPPPDFQERDWADVVRTVPARNEAPARFQPPATVAVKDAIAQFEASVALWHERSVRSPRNARDTACPTRSSAPSRCIRQATSRSLT